MEECIHCPNDHWAYEYAYGSERWFIFDKEFYAHYTESKETADKRDAEMKELIESRKDG